MFGSYYEDNKNNIIMMFYINYFCYLNLIFSIFLKFFKIEKRIKYVICVFPIQFVFQNKNL